MAKSKKAWKRPNGQGTVVKLAGNRRKPYLAKIGHVDRKNGEMHMVNVGTFESSLEAENALYLYSTNQSVPGNNDQDMPTLRDLFDKVFDVDYPGGLAENTVKERRAAIKHLDGILEMRIGKLNGRVLQEYFDDQMAKKKTYSALENCRAALIRIYDYAIKYDFAEKNYAKYLEIADAPKGKKK